MHASGIFELYDQTRVIDLFYMFANTCREGGLLFKENKL